MIAEGFLFLLLETDCKKLQQLLFACSHSQQIRKGLQIITVYSGYISINKLAECLGHLAVFGFCRIRICGIKVTDVIFCVDKRQHSCNFWNLTIVTLSQTYCNN